MGVKVDPSPYGKNIQKVFQRTYQRGMFGSMIRSETMMEKIT